MTSVPLTSEGTRQSIATQLDTKLQASGYQAGAVLNSSLANGWLQVEVRGIHKIWTVEVDAKAAVLERLPAVRLVAPLLLLAHVAHDQTICINDGQGLSIDVARPGDILSQVLCDAIRILDGAALDATKGYRNLFDELEGYWEGMPHGILARTSVEADTTSRLVYAHVENQGKRNLSCWYFSERTGNQPSEFRTSKLANFAGLYVALDHNVAPPSPLAPLDAKFIHSILAAFGPKERQLWEALKAKRWSGVNRLCCMLLSHPRPSGGRSLIGLTFNLRHGKLDPNGQVRHLVVRRHTPAYMRERGGASNAHSTKHVAILGCGSVGSELADALATCGIGKLTLVDFDNLDIENVFRHVLGKDTTGLKKVDSLKTELLRKYPGIDVAAIPSQASTWLASTAAKHVDTIVIAVGSPASERTLCRQIRTLGLRCSLIITWLEVLGLGGHVIAVPSNGEGCLDCLYRGDEGQESLHPGISFLAPGQVVSRSLSGCLGTFIPYSAIHSRKTALLAAETVLKTLTRSAEPRYEYWVGDDTQAKDQGIETSAWFKRAGTLDSASATKIVFRAPCQYCAQEV